MFVYNIMYVAPCLHRNVWLADESHRERDEVWISVLDPYGVGRKEKGHELRDETVYQRPL